MRPHAGNRDRLISFWRRSSTKDAMGGEVDTWTQFAQAYAEKSDVSDGERWKAGEVAAVVTTRFRALWDSDTCTVTPRDRIRLDGLEYDISGIKELGRREGLEFTANGRNDSQG